MVVGAEQAVRYPTFRSRVRGRRSDRAGDAEGRRAAHDLVRYQAMIWRWAVLIVLSAVVAALLEVVGLPAGLLLGPMVAAVVLAVRGWSLSVPTSAFRGAQAAVGTLIAGSITTGIVATVADHWPVFLMVNFVTLAASSVLGYLLSR